MKIGEKGEIIAAKSLKSKGYEIVDTNFSCRFGEIDIVMKNKEFIVFVEVKTRGKNPIVGALESVDYNKRRRLTAAANIYLKKFPCELQPRFDVMAVEHDNGVYTVTEHIENAF